ncbi:M20/M25/M40 family metallo-hydrolase [Formicincola oecophyllae]|uniref:M20/M25/M40 family metallo-hydrolase n=2 Tax=Formicincola oecophyllae TaxID=2558361 RepID=A0A4Y6UAJ6_9PROT|nr:M20/M25/M40 family metallo-hydrolase [Formicincola oecophyllae]
MLALADATFPQAVARFADFLRIPSISTDPAHASDCRTAAQWVAGQLRELGLEAALHEVNWAPPGHPVVMGHHDEAGQPGAGDVGTATAGTGTSAGKPTLLFYGHYDVQPVDPLALWQHPPFEPTILQESDGREVMAARGASDDKGQLLTFLEALRIWQAQSGSLPCNLRILIEGEEETGGENLPFFLEAHKAQLDADLVLVCDTGMPNRTTPAVTTSLRGLVADEVTIHGADRDLHSGMYGGAAANPATLMARALATLHDANGAVTLPGFYEGVSKPTEQQLASWRGLFPDENLPLRAVGLAQPAGERGFSALEQTWARPSCDINGLSSGYEGEGFKTVLPASATAKVSFRLVAGQDPEKVRATFRAHMASHMPPDVRISFKPYGASPGFALDRDNKWLAPILEGLSAAWGTKGACIGCGASIPLAEQMKTILGLDAFLVGFAQDDDRIHSPNERYGLDSYRNGIRSWLHILHRLTQPGAAPGQGNAPAPQPR